MPGTSDDTKVDSEEDKEKEEETFVPAPLTEEEVADGWELERASKENDWADVVHTDPFSFRSK